MDTLIFKGKGKQAKKNKNKLDLDLPLVNTFGYLGPPEWWPVPLTLLLTLFQSIATRTQVCFAMLEMMTCFLLPPAACNLENRIFSVEIYMCSDIFWLVIWSFWLKSQELVYCQGHGSKWAKCMQVVWQIWRGLERSWNQFTIANLVWWWDWCPKCLKRTIGGGCYMDTGNSFFSLEKLLTVYYILGGTKPFLIHPIGWVYIFVAGSSMSVTNIFWLWWWGMFTNKTKLYLIFFASEKSANKSLVCNNMLRFTCSTYKVKWWHAIITFNPLIIVHIRVNYRIICDVLHF